MSVDPATCCFPWLDMKLQTERKLEMIARRLIPLNVPELAARWRAILTARDKCQLLPEMISVVRDRLTLHSARQPSHPQLNQLLPRQLFFRDCRKHLPNERLLPLLLLLLLRARFAPQPTNTTTITAAITLQADTGVSLCYCVSVFCVLSLAGANPRIVVTSCA